MSDQRATAYTQNYLEKDQTNAEIPVYRHGMIFNVPEEKKRYNNITEDRRAAI